MRGVLYSTRTEGGRERETRTPGNFGAQNFFQKKKIKWRRKNYHAKAEDNIS